MTNGPDWEGEIHQSILYWLLNSISISIDWKRVRKKLNQSSRLLYFLFLVSGDHPRLTVEIVGGIAFGSKKVMGQFEGGPLRKIVL
jgi:nitrate reductase NapE component